MFRIMLIYGLIAGLIVIAVVVIGFQLSGGEIAEGSQLVGYLTMLVAMSLIFVGVKRYRDQALGGVIKFWRAFGLGVGIAAVAGVAYVVGWEVYTSLSGIDFAGAYLEAQRETYIAEGLTGAALQDKLKPLQDMMALYENWWFRLPITFTEIFPIGLLVALVSALLLRNPKILPARA